MIPETSIPTTSRSAGRAPRVPRRLGAVGARAVVVAALAAFAAFGLSACSSDPTLGDLPKDVAQARPTITAEEADFVLDAQKLGATVTGTSVSDDIETGTTTCWALQNGGVTLKQIAVGDDNKPLGNTGDALRTKQLMAAGVQAFCPHYTDQIPQLGLP